MNLNKLAHIIDGVILAWGFFTFMSLAEKQQIMQQRIREQMMRQMGGGQ